MEASLIRQIRVLQVAVLALLAISALLCINAWQPFIPTHFGVINAEQVKVREKDGTIKAMLSNSAGFSSEGDRTKKGGVPFSGLMFYNQEGQEEGGLVYSGMAIPGGQDADVTLTFDQYRQDQNIYLHHEEHKDSDGRAIDDGLTIISRPDQAAIRAEYKTYQAIGELPADARESAKLKALQDGTISTRRLFVGNRRGVKNNVPYDDAGVFIKNRWGRDAIKLFVDYDNKPHLEIYDQLGKSVIYNLAPMK